MNKYRFEWNNRTAYVDADSWEEARTQFQQRFGFWPAAADVNESQMMGY